MNEKSLKQLETVKKTSIYPQTDVKESLYRRNNNSK